MQAEKAPAVRSLEEQRREYASRRGIAMPLAGLIAWALIGVVGALAPPLVAVWTLFIATGFIVLLGMRISRYTGEDFLAKDRPRNAFDSLFFHTVAMSLMVYAIAIPFFEEDYTSLPLTVGILSGLMWLPLSWIVQHWVGAAHAIVRTVLVVAVWYAFPHARFVAVPAAIVVVYLVTIVVLEQRWRAVLKRAIA